MWAFLYPLQSFIFVVAQLVGYEACSRCPHLELFLLFYAFVLAVVGSMWAYGAGLRCSSSIL